MRWRSFLKVIRGPRSPERSSDVPNLAGRVATPGHEFSEFLPGALAVTCQPPPVFAKALIYIGAAFVLTLLLWSAFSSADKVVTAQGKVRPAGQVQIINHPTGGVVSAAYVKAGDHVVPGQKLMSFDPVSTTEELNKLRVQYDTLSAEIARLEAEDRETDAPTFPDGLGVLSPDIVVVQGSLFAERRASRKQQRLALSSEVLQRQATISQYQARVKSAEHVLEIAERQEKAVSSLAARGYYPKLRALQMEREVASLRSESEQSEALLTTGRGALDETMAKLARLDRDYRSEILQGLSDKRAQIVQTRAAIAQDEERLRNLELAAPVAGIIEKLQVVTIGQAVTPGKEIMHVVPDNQNYIVDVSVHNRDIGLIREGLPVTLKLLAYDYQRYGTIRGKVTVVATDSVPDEREDELYFTVQVVPEKPYLGDNPRFRIQSGMAVETDFHVGTRTVLSYIVDAIMRQRDEAFRE